MKISVVMPVYNQRATLRKAAERVLAGPLEIELLSVDEGSNDGSREILSQLRVEDPRIRIRFSLATRAGLWLCTLVFTQEKLPPGN